ncbi:MAG: aldo/keto reductase [Candidatus Tectomicrobia bacterium]|nr:aldo/keto reductase [Candidatus Tectomicrobia bacterium]
MEYRTLGSTGLRISAVAVGCGNVGGLFTGDASDVQVEAVRRVVELGIVWFDTAPQYGAGRSEANLGRALEEAGARTAQVSTKVRLAYEDLRDIAGAVRRSAEASLERLGLDRVALLQLHNRITEVRGTQREAVGVWDVLGRRGVLEALERLRGEGLCQATGFTALGETAALKVAVRSGGFQAAQVYYNLLNPTAGHPAPAGFPAQDYGCLLDEMAEQRMGALAIRALADQPRPELPGPALSRGSDFAEDRRRAATLAPLAGRFEVPLARAALRFALADARVSAVLVGASDVTQMEEAVQALAEGSLPAAFLETWGRLWVADFYEGGKRLS